MSIMRCKIHGDTELSVYHCQLPSYMPSYLRKNEWMCNLHETVKCIERSAENVHCTWNSHDFWCFTIWARVADVTVFVFYINDTFAVLWQCLCFKFETMSKNRVYLATHMQGIAPILTHTHTHTLALIVLLYGVIWRRHECLRLWSALSQSNKMPKT